MSLHDAPEDDLHDAELRRRYRALPPELPSAGTDAAILAAARRAVVAGPRRARTGLWTGGLATAATVTLMVALLVPHWRSGELAEQVAVAPPAAPARPSSAPVSAPSPADDVAERAAAVPATADTAAAPAPAAPGQAGSLRRQPAPASEPAAIAPAQRVDAQAQQAALAARAARDAAAGQREIAATAAAQREAARHAERARARPLLMAPPPAPPVVSAELDAVKRADSGEPSPFMAAPKSIARQSPAPLAGAAAPAAPLPASPASDTQAHAKEESERLAAPAGQPFSYDAALLQGLYRPALGWLVSGPEADVPGREAERDLLRQMLEPGAALRCRDEGPASAQRLCLLLHRHAAGMALTEDDIAAFAEALRRDGREPLPLVQTLRRLRAGAAR